MGSERRQFSDQFKFTVALEATKGLKTVSQIAGEYDIHTEEVRTWKYQLLAEGPAAFGVQRSDVLPEQATRETEWYEQSGLLKGDLERLKKGAPESGPSMQQDLSAEPIEATDQISMDGYVASPTPREAKFPAHHSNFVYLPNVVKIHRSSVEFPSLESQTTPEPDDDVIDKEFLPLEPDLPSVATAAAPAFESEDIAESGAAAPNHEFHPEKPPLPLAATDTAPAFVANGDEEATIHFQSDNRPVTKRKRDKLSLPLLLLSLMFLVIAALIYFAKPFTRLALANASIAQPARTRDLPGPTSINGDWCLGGDFLGTGTLPMLVDTGTQGDALANDRVYSLNYTIPQPGYYLWHVVNCADPALAYPAINTAWIQTDQPEQPVTFTFDTNERNSSPASTITFALNALDSTEGYRAVGDFQGWNIDDPAFLLERVNSGLYQQALQIAHPGTYQGYIIEEDEWRAIDAYGRTYDPISFIFTTTRNDEYVVFLLDIDRGGASVLGGISPIMAQLAFGSGANSISLAAAVISGFFLSFFLLRLLIFQNRNLWLETGCPQCGRHELLRISRLRRDLFWHLLKIPRYRYHCRNCTWEGMRLREDD